MKKFQKNRVLDRALIETLEMRRLLSAGGLDTSFSGDGKVTAGFTDAFAGAAAMALQSDGKIVEAGASVEGGDVTLVRYNANGTLDTTFGPTQSGKVIIQDGPEDNLASGNAVAIQTDGKIVVGASTGLDDSEKFDIYRFNSDGSLDKSFGSNGKVNVDVGLLTSGGATAIAIQKDGKIVVAGTVEHVNLITGINDNFEVVRLNTNGSLDGTFGVLKPTSNSLRTGMMQVDFGGDEEAWGLVIDYNDTAATNPDYGRIVVSGYQEDGVVNTKTAVARLNTNGTLDTSFAGDGHRIDTLAGDKYATANAVTIVGDGYVVTAGGYAADRTKTLSEGYLLRSFTPSGAINTSFGTGGIVKTTLNGGDTEAYSIINGSFQDLIVGGTTGDQFGLAAYTLSGKIDPAFGNQGKVITSLLPSNNLNISVVDGLALGPNHTIIAGGGSQFGAARYFDIVPNVSVTSPDPTAGPTTSKVIGFRGKIPVTEILPNNASLVVTRDEKLNVATRVFFTIGGTSLPPSLTNVKTKKNNYTLSGMTILPALLNAKTLSGYVDIPAGQTSITVTFTPNIIPASNTTATFSIQSNVAYAPSFPPSQTITILGKGTTPPPPAATTLTDTADTYIQDGSTADTNFGAATQLLVKKSSTTGQNRETYLKFDLSSLSTVNSVKLNLFGALNNTDSPSLVTQVFSIADNSWLETGITWNKRRTPGATALASATITGTTPAMYSFDVTAYIKAQLAAGIKTVSFVLINSANTSPAVIFNSKEAASNKPTLTVS
jgi:uncharacterized delta-60 repeat protein